MTAPQRGFEIAEFASRCNKAQLAMAAEDIGALLLTNDADIRYFTGFMTQFWQSPTRPWFVLIPASGKPVAIIPSIGVPLMRDCYIGDLQSWPSPAADDDGITLLVSVIHDHLATCRNQDEPRACRALPKLGHKAGKITYISVVC